MLICIIGRHGTGKTTIGKALESKGFTHISVGDLKRSCWKKVYPKDIPPKLLGMLSVQPPNALLSMTCAKELMAFVQRIPKCVLDGFPPAKEYVDLLPTDTVFLYCMTPKVLREKRLAERAMITGRKWTPCGRSVRDAELASLVRAVRGRFRMVVVLNDGQTVGEVVGRIHLP